ncbi:MAG: HEAT repeat domain-containing protein, partial [Candidatus Zixiibacteriota bacterium]
VNFQLQSGRLHVLNFRLKESVFTDELVQYMQIQEMNCFLIEQIITIAEFNRWMDRFVRRVNLSQADQHMSAWLAKTGIHSLEINSERVFNLFEQSRHYRGDVDGDFAIKTIIANALGDSPDTLADILLRGQSALDQRSIDFDLDLIHYVIPERVASISIEALTDMVSKAEKAAEAGDESAKQRWQALNRLLDYHPKKTNALHPSSRPSSKDFTATTSNAIEGARSEAADKVCSVIATIKQGLLPDVSTAGFGDDFARLLRTGQSGLAATVCGDLLDTMLNGDSSVRQKALELLLAVVRQIDCTADSELIESITQKLRTVFSSRTETYEMADVVLELAVRSILNRSFTHGAKLVSMLSGRRRYAFSGIEYDSIAIKRIADGLSRAEVLDILVDELIRADHATAGQLRDVFVGIGTEAVAMALSKIISHPIRQVRQQSLRILAELGKSSLSVFCQVVNDDSLFLRDSGRRELPDAKWYVVRNSMFVLGSLRDPYAIAPLRLRISDADVRVRREIVSALEKIGGDDAVDMLVLMAEDSDKEIREAAVATFGIVASQESIPLLIDLVQRIPSLTHRVVAALGKIGGEVAEEYLLKLLDDSDRQAQMVTGGQSREEIRLAIIKALGQIGNPKALTRIKEFQNSLTTTQKIFFKNSPLQKVITDILSRK